MNEGRDSLDESPRSRDIKNIKNKSYLYDVLKTANPYKCASKKRGFFF